MAEPIWITGLGLVTPLGVGVAPTWQALLAGASGIRPIGRFDASGFAVRIGAEVPLGDATDAVAPRLRKFAGRQHGFATHAAAEALRDAGVAPTDTTAPRWGCALGCGQVTLDYDELVATAAAAAPQGELQPARLAAPCDPIAFARQQSIAPLALLATQFGLRGPLRAVHTACASGGQAIGSGLKMLRRGEVDFVLAGGTDAMLTPIGLAGFCLLGALSADNDDPARASRPFDRTRNGFVLGEGAGMMVLERADTARARGAPPYAELAGEGNALSSYRITDPHPDGRGPIQAMRRALADAGESPAAVDYINAHGTSTPMNDRSECAAIHALFGAAVDRLLVSSTKGQIGHLIAAAGAVEAAFCALALRDAVAPPNANLHHPDPACALPFVGAAPQRRALRVALSNSFGFGGANSSLVLRAAGAVA
ncbi:MAG: beta-ketoacyl-[acyl-carrier-protein] synthase family protein [Deltaproteobacteria bacterium]|nr:beta-ketoacyl-[acyl-carrier-protein] synthase family protein [Deltaproteobacteria bacterium]